nr:S8 family serine peptidase [Acidobacteriota bacterium]
ARTSTVLGAINWVITNGARYNVRIINMSMGTPVRESYKNDPLCQAVERAVRVGIVVVTSAGNNGHTSQVVGYDNQGKPIYQLAYGTISSPANSPYALTVGAVDNRSTVKRSDDFVAQYSSKGPTQFDHLAKPDVVAPGSRLIAAMSQASNPTFNAKLPQNVQHPLTANGMPNAYFKYSGTSFAAPVVAGTVALMLQANKSLTPRLVKAALMRTAESLPGVKFGNKAQSVVTQGAGQVNTAGAVGMARAIVPNANKLAVGDHLFGPEMTMTKLGNTTIGGETVASNVHVIYCDGVLFGDHPLLVNGILVGDGILLSDGWILSNGILVGDGILLSDGILVGDGILLSDGILVGDGILLSDGILVGDGILLSD